MCASLKLNKNQGYVMRGSQCDIDEKNLREDAEEEENKYTGSDSDVENLNSIGHLFQNHQSEEVENDASEEADDYSVQ